GWADAPLAKAINDIEAVQKGKGFGKVVRTGFERFDRKSRGLKPGELVLIAARPSVGKTAFALNIAANVAMNKDDPKTVAIFSLEMPAELLAKRMLSYVSGVSLSKMDVAGGLSRGDSYQTLVNAYKVLSSKNIFIDDYSMNGPADVLSKCRRLKREKGLDLVIIDYLQLMTNVGANGRAMESRQVEVSDMSRKMKIYAKELDCPIILLSQMSRGIEQRNDHTPLLSDLRESGSIEQDADIVMFLYNPSRYNAALPDNQVILDVKKNRNGPIGGIMLEWTGETTTFREIGEVDSTQSNEKEKPASESVLEQMRSAVEQKSNMLDVNESLPFGEGMPFGGDMPSDEDAPPPRDSASFGGVFTQLAAADNVDGSDNNSAGYGADNYDASDSYNAPVDDDEYEYDDDDDENGDGDLPF
ncbi:MAG: DnaB-like helicase C-terminal domain-containing protein, partial [Clostridia bacterium]|nr:DnaB-like helicase C-terminal domain-containing protein [Clostridia bacterium]